MFGFRKVTIGVRNLIFERRILEKRNVSMIYVYIEYSGIVSSILLSLHCKSIGEDL